MSLFSEAIRKPIIVQHPFIDLPGEMTVTQSQNSPDSITNTVSAHRQDYMDIRRVLGKHGIKSVT